MVRREIITEDGCVSQQLLNSNYDESCEYDVVVVGSGMGGGVIASALADEGKKVLVLEAGSMLFQTHVGNLPRRLQIGKFQKQIWSLYDKFTVENFDKDSDGEYAAYCGAQAFNLGGRSMFWGASIPELADWELNSWPKSVQEYLVKEGYTLAKQTFNADVPELKAFHGVASEKIQKVLGDSWTVEPASVAVEYAGATEWTVPSGIFSTADLLIEDSMVENAECLQGKRQPLTVNLHQQAWSLCFKGNKVDGVNCFDLLHKKQRTFRGKAIVLAAGTLESAKIALQSNIPNPLIGKGITDHPIWYRHFVIPPTAKALQGIDLTDMEPESTKIIIRHKSATVANHGFDVVLELGSQWNQGRFVDRDHITDDLKARKGYMLCEIVFQFYSELEESNCVTLQGWNKPVRVNMKKCPTPLLEEARCLAATILKEFDACKVLEEPLDLYCGNGLVNLEEAKVGGVAHEVGTLRMPTRGARGVVDEHLKFEGYDNLFACDNSVFPCSPAGNPSLTLVALARRCAKDIVKVIHGECLTTPVSVEQSLPIRAKYPLHEKYPTSEAFEKHFAEEMAKVERGEAVGNTIVHERAAWNLEESNIKSAKYPLHERWSTQAAYDKHYDEEMAKVARGEGFGDTWRFQRAAWLEEESKIQAEKKKVEEPVPAPAPAKYPLHEKYPTQEAFEKHFTEEMAKVERGEAVGNTVVHERAAWNLEESNIQKEKAAKETVVSTVQSQSVETSETEESDDIKIETIAVSKTQVVSNESKMVTSVVTEIHESSIEIS